MSLQGVAGNAAYGAIGDVVSLDVLERQIFDQVEQDRHANYELMPLATEGLVQGRNGLQLFLPYMERSTTPGEGNMWEDVASTTVAGQYGATPTTFGNDQTGLPLGATNDTFTLANLRQVTMSDQSVALTYYADGFRITKTVLRATGNGEKMYQRGLQRLSRYIAKTHEEHLKRLFTVQIDKQPLYDASDAIANADQFTVSGGAFVQADAPMLINPISANDTPPAWGAYVGTTVPVANRIAFVRNRLQRPPNNNPMFDELGGNYAGIIGPDTFYYLLNYVTQADGEATITFEQESMNQAQVYRGGKLPVLFDVAMINSNDIPIWPGTFLDSPGYDAGSPVDCEINMFFAPEAIYKVPSEALPPEIHVIAPQANAADLTGSNAIITTDFAFAAMRSPYFSEKAAIMATPVLAG